MNNQLNWHQWFSCNVNIDLTSLIAWRMDDGFSFGSRNCLDVAVLPILSAVCSRVWWKNIFYLFSTLTTSYSSKRVFSWLCSNKKYLFHVCIYIIGTIKSKLTISTQFITSQCLRCSRIELRGSRNKAVPIMQTRKGFPGNDLFVRERTIAVEHTM